MSEQRFVVDTNLVVSAVLFKHSVPAQALEKATKTGKLLFSEETQEELREVLSRPKFDKYLPEAARLQFLLQLTVNALLIPVTVTITDCRDPKDNKFLELAVSGNATHLISGDEDLLVLHPFREIAILTPADFLRVVGEGQE